jgi:cytochrome d ubiquinol oxidase subunit II
VLLDHDDHALLRALLSGGALVAAIASALGGLTTIALLARRRHQPARYTAALAVAAVIAAVALARWPAILPGLSVDRAAAGHDTLVWITVAVLAGAVILFPSLALLFRLTLTGRLQAVPAPTSATPSGARAWVGRRLLARAAVGGLIAGVGLLTFADGGWAHAVGLACLLAFAVAAFLAIVPAAVGGGEETP